MTETAIAPHCCFYDCELTSCSCRQPAIGGRRVFFYAIGDICAGALLGASLAVVHVYLVPRGTPMLAGMLVVLSVVMLLQMLLCFALGAIIGSMEAMLPGNLAGMAVMLMPFWPALSSRGRGYELAAASAVSAAVFLGFTLYDAATRGTPVELAPAPHVRAIAPSASHTLSTPSWLYDLLEYVGSRRRAPLQRQLFARMGCKVLFAAAGTGLNFAQFPPFRQIVAIDLNPRMLPRARQRAQRYCGNLQIQLADVQQLPFAEASFDTVATASTFCSVPDPAQAMAELYRVLLPGGRLLMFEHVRSRNRVLGAELDLLNCMMRYLGPVMTRDTVQTVQDAGFVIDSVRHGYLDVFLSIEAHKPSNQYLSSSRDKE